jgi:acetate---CoA ligase (ADP-forming)
MPHPDLESIIAELRDGVTAGHPAAIEPLGKALLRSVGIRTPKGRQVSTPAEAAAAMTELPGPVAVKVVSPDVVHKTDVGGVRGPLDSAAEVEAAATDLLARLDGELLVEAWETDGVEAFVGLSLHGPLGAVMTVGLGGIWVEILRDVAHRAAPLNPLEVVEAFSSLRAAPLLLGGRGRSAMDIAHAADAIARLSQMVVDPSLRAVVSTIDINPLLLRDGAAPVALDCTIILRTQEAGIVDSNVPVVAEVAT